MAKITLKSLKKPTAATFRGWVFVLFAGVVLAVLALIDRGGLGEPGSTAAGSAGCLMRVGEDGVNVRTGPSEGAAPSGDRLARDATVTATREVVGTFRRLADGRWVAERFLTPLPGTNCG